MDTNVFNAVKAAFAKVMLDCAFASSSSMPLQVLTFRFFEAKDIDTLRAEVTEASDIVPRIGSVLPDIVVAGRSVTNVDVLNYLVAKHQ